jgi:transposase-like protein
MSNEHNARTTKNCFTIVELCREHDINAKIARRRMRDAIKRNDERVVNARVRDAIVDDQRVKHEFVDNKTNRKNILSIITNERS